VVGDAERDFTFRTLRAGRGSALLSRLENEARGGPPGGEIRYVERR